MNALLVVLTFGALALSGALVFYILRLTRQERDRSAARAAMLSDAMSDAPAPTPDDTPVGSGLDPWIARQRPVFTGGSGTAQGRPLLVPAAGLLVLCLAVGAFYAVAAGREDAIATPAPLELLSLAHERQGDRVTVSGVLRNPTSGSAVSGVTAVAFAFDRGGTFLTSSRAALDYSRLAPGEESPFTVVIPSNAGRYRVSFRTDERMLPHVDRREPDVNALPARAQVPR